MTTTIAILLSAWLLLNAAFLTIRIYASSKRISSHSDDGLVQYPRLVR